MSVTINKKKVNELYKGQKKIARIYKGVQLLLGTKLHDIKTFTTSGSFTLPNRLVSLTITVIGGGGASGGWGNNRHGYHTPGAGGNGGKVIHEILNANIYSNTSISYIVGSGGIAGTLQYTGKFHGYSASKKGGDSSIQSFNLVATGGYQGYTMDQGQSTDSQSGTGTGGNVYNGVSTDAYPSNGSGAPVPNPYGGGINGTSGVVIFDYYYWK